MMERIGNEHIAHITRMLAHFLDDVILVTLLAEELHLREIVLVINVNDRQNTNTDHRRSMHVHLAADDLGGIFLVRLSRGKPISSSKLRRDWFKLCWEMNIFLLAALIEPALTTSIRNSNCSIFILTPQF